MRAEARREAADRRLAADLAWRARAFLDTAPRPSRRRAREVARARRVDGRFMPRRLAREAYLALRLVVAFALRGGGASLTPARRAFESPMAIACLVERAPCLPSRTCSISSRTNEPACVLGALPLRFACRARFNVCFSGMWEPPVCVSAIAALDMPRPSVADATRDVQAPRLRLPVCAVRRQTDREQRRERQEGQ